MSAITYTARIQADRIGTRYDVALYDDVTIVVCGTPLLYKRGRHIVTPEELTDLCAASDRVGVTRGPFAIGEPLTSEPLGDERSNDESRGDESSMPGPRGMHSINAAIQREPARRHDGENITPKR